MLLTWSLSRVPFSNKTGLPYVQRFGSNLAITLYLPFSFSSCSDSSLFESFFFAVCFCSESSCVANSFVDSATSFCWEVSTIFSASALSCSTVVSSLFISNSLLFRWIPWRLVKRIINYKSASQPTSGSHHAGKSKRTYHILHTFLFTILFHSIQESLRNLTVVQWPLSPRNQLREIL